MKINLFSLLLAAASVASLFSACASFHALAWTPAPKPAFAGPTALNTRLTTGETIALNGWYGPEDIVFDAQGNLFCGVHRAPEVFNEGAILKISPAGGVEVWYEAGSWVAGLHFDAEGNLLVLSHREGLIRISPDKQVTVLATQDASGKRLLIPNGLDLASDGKVYFTNTSEVAPYTIAYGRKIILEMKPLGGLYCYDPATRQVQPLIEGTYFGNGVVLAQDENSLLMVETIRYRVLRYWLNGPKAGQTEVFADNLPGFPNGISIRPDGTYWLGFSTKRNDPLDNIHPKPGMKKLVYGLPTWMQPKADLFGMVLHLGKEGEILGGLFDPTGAHVPEAGAVKEQAGWLYLGGDVVPQLTRVKVE